MELQDEEDILNLIQQDKWMKEILRSARRLQLPDWWICAGFVRSKVWDTLHNYSERTLLSDVDVIYFDSENISIDQDKKWEPKLKRIQGNVPWSVKNEARMHLRNDIPPYMSSEDAISKFPETATALGVKMANNGELILTAPHGVKDVLDMRVCPSPGFCRNLAQRTIYKERIINKQWKEKWPKIQIIQPKE